MNDLDHIDWAGIPEHSRDSLKLYFEMGVPLGSFLSAVISNDLTGACSQADHINRHHIFSYVQFLYCFAPAPCWGSPEAYKEWVKKGGLKGREAA